MMYLKLIFIILDRIGLLNRTVYYNKEGVFFFNPNQSLGHNMYDSYYCGIVS